MSWRIPPWTWRTKLLLSPLQLGGKTEAGESVFEGKTWTLVNAKETMR
jgi:hypothetical protein